ncbi:hypothetical protein LTR17_024064 [Elasticomyces elasticus]|nr:hypothetical protein LTR17_024064 [Elasticomyces elasticus]
MRYQHPDLKQITTFMGGVFHFMCVFDTQHECLECTQDFGLRLVKKTPTQIGSAVTGRTSTCTIARKDLWHSLVKGLIKKRRILQIPSVEILAGGIQGMTDAPSGGHLLSISDPEGFPVNFVSGQAAKTGEVMRPDKIVYNDVSAKPQKRKFQRFDAGPASVYKVAI